MGNKSTPSNYLNNEGRATMKKAYLVTVLLVLFMDLAFLIFMGIWTRNASAQMGGMLPPPMGYKRMGGWEHPGAMAGPAGLPGDGMMIEMMMDAGHPIWRHLRELGLDEKQKGEIREMESRVMKAMIRKRADEQIAGIELRDLLEKDPVDMKAVERMVKRIEVVRTEIHLSLIGAVEEVKTRLTPDQRKKLREMLKAGPGMRESGLREKRVNDRPGMRRLWEMEADEIEDLEMDIRNPWIQ